MTFVPLKTWSNRSQTERLQWMVIKLTGFVSRKLKSVSNFLLVFSLKKIIILTVSTYTEIDIRKVKRGKPSSLKIDLPLLRPQGKPISQDKLNDIRSFMHLIPEAHQKFYKNFVGDKDVNDDVDGFNGELDFEVEEDQ